MTEPEGLWDILAMFPNPHTATKKLVQPYLIFGGRTEEAIEFYKTVLGAEVETLMRFKDNPDACMPDMDGEKIMHSSIRIGESVIMASDGGCSGAEKFSGFSLSLNLDSMDEAKKYFDALAQSGKVEMPLAETFFSPGFGIVEDRFGVSWMIVVDPK